LSSVGHVAVPRRYYYCRHCKAGQTPWEVWAGIGGTHRVTPHARRMIVLAGSRSSFDEASQHLKELSALRVSNDLVRRVCDEEGKAVQQWMNRSPRPRTAFEKAAGHIEFSTDGLKINTVDGWREMRLSVMSKRTAALPAVAAQWDDRPLEAPGVRVGICAIAPAGHIGASWERLCRTLGVAGDQTLSVIADGAKWIWDQAAKRFKGQDVQWVVDVYHVMLYLYAAVASLGPDAAGRWVHRCVIELIERGGPRFVEHLKATGPPDAASIDAWNTLLNYLTENRDSLWYGQRLAAGLPIGSGLIEGGVKNTLAKRLKLNSARWRVRRAERMGAIRCLQYSNLWEAYWESKAAA
jgi:hypothetical protein